MARRELPKNVRRAALALAVGRAAERRKSVTNGTPTPAPVAVEDGMMPERGRGEGPVARESSWPSLLALVVIACAAFFGLRRGLEGLSLRLPTGAELAAFAEDPPSITESRLYKDFFAQGEPRPAARQLAPTVRRD